MYLIRSTSVAPITGRHANERAGQGVAGVTHLSRQSLQPAPRQPIRRPAAAASTTITTSTAAADDGRREQLGDGPRADEQQWLVVARRRPATARPRLAAPCAAQHIQPPQRPRVDALVHHRRRHGQLDRSRHGYLHGPQHDAQRSGASVRKTLHVYTILLACVCVSVFVCACLCVSVLVCACCACVRHCWTVHRLA